MTIPNFFKGLDLDLRQMLENLFKERTPKAYKNIHETKNPIRAYKELMLKKAWSIQDLRNKSR